MNFYSFVFCCAAINHMAVFMNSIYKDKYTGLLL